MTVETLREAISLSVEKYLPEALLRHGIINHKRGWKDCPCSWCDKKREATLVIGSHCPPAWRGSYVEDMREAWREDQRVKFRKQLKDLERV